jgi:hypothetical protein
VAGCGARSGIDGDPGTNGQLAISDAKPADPRPDVALGVGGFINAPVVAPPSIGTVPVEAGGAPASCDTVSSVTPGAACELTTSCPDSFSRTSCYLLGDGRSRCTCTDGLEYRTVDISGVAPDEACAAATEECLNVTPVVAPEKCAFNNDNSGLDTCSLDEVCESSVTKDGLTFTTRRTHSSNCYRNGPNWECSCDSAKELQFESVGFAGALSSVGLCADALRTCQQGTMQTVQTACEPEGLSTTETDCTLEQRCRKDAVTLSGTPVFTTQSVSVQCLLAQQGSATWRCDCQDGTPELTLLGMDSPASCEQAAKVCSERL